MCNNKMIIFLWARKDKSHAHFDELKQPTLYVVPVSEALAV